MMAVCYDCCAGPRLPSRGRAAGAAEADGGGENVKKEITWYDTWQFFTMVAVEGWGPVVLFYLEEPQVTQPTPD